MASPQIKNGYTAIANEILEYLVRWHLSSYEWSCLLFVIRKTYGWHKKEDWISLSQFVVATGISRPHVCRALKMLTIQNLITKGGTSYKPLYCFQKDFDKWRELPKGARSHHVTKGGNDSLPKGVIQLVPKGAHTKETITKETEQKENSPPKVREETLEEFRKYREKLIIKTSMNNGNA